MKKLVIYILLVLYVAIQLKPLTVIIEDVVAHTFYKMQHLATVHYENGHYHLHTDLKQINDNSQEDKTPVKSSSQKTETNLQQLLTQIHFNFKIHASLIPSIIIPAPNIKVGHIQSPFIPPKTV